MGKRARLFHHVCKFLLRWDPESFKCECRSDHLKSQQTISLNSIPDKTSNNIKKNGMKRSSTATSSLDLGTTDGTSDNENRGQSLFPVHHLYVVDENGFRESNLAKNVPEFPDDLLGGRDSHINNEVRKMYGYAKA